MAYDDHRTYELIAGLKQDTDGLFFPFSLREESIHKTLADALKRLGDCVLELRDEPYDPSGHPGAARPIHDSDSGWKKGSHVRRFENGEEESNLEAMDGLVDDLLLGISHASACMYIPDDVGDPPEELRGALRSTVARDVVIPPVGKAFPLIKPLTLKAARFSGVESGVSAAGAVLLEMIAVAEGDSGSESKTLRRLARALARPEGDILSFLADALISVDAFPDPGPADEPLPLSWKAKAHRRRILPLAPSIKLEKNVKVLLDALEGQLVNRDTFYSMFCTLASLRLAQYLGEIASLAGQYAARLRKIVRSGYDPALGHAGFLEPDRLQQETRLPLVVGEGIYRCLHEPLQGYARDVKLIHLARLRAGDLDPVVLESKPAEALSHDDWNIDAARGLVQRLVELGPDGLRAEDIDAHDRGQTVARRQIKVSGTMRAMMRDILNPASRGRLHRVFPTDDLIHALAVVETGTEGRCLYEQFLDRLDEGGLRITGPAREKVADRLMKMGLMNEMPDAERFREVVVRDE